MKTSEIFTEICNYKNWSPSDIDYAANCTLIRKKFRFLMNRIVFRDSDNYKYLKTKTYDIPDEDAAIVKELLIMAIKGNGEDKTCKKWFNGSLKLNNYKGRATLFCKIDEFLQSLLQKHEISENTYHKWYAVIDTSLYGNTSIQILNLYFQIDALVEASVGMNNHVHLHDTLTDDIAYLFPPQYLETTEFISEKKICDLVYHDICQEDYFRSLNSITEYMTADAFERTCLLIESFKPEIYHRNPIHAKIQEANLAFEGYGLFEQLYIFLKNNPDALTQISENIRIDADDILKYFKFKNRDKS